MPPSIVCNSMIIMLSLLVIVRGRTSISIVFCPPLFLHIMCTLSLLYEMLMCAGNKLNWNWICQWHPVVFYSTDTTRQLRRRTLRTNSTGCDRIWCKCWEWRCRAACNSPWLRANDTQRARRQTHDGRWLQRTLHVKLYPRSTIKNYPCVGTFYSTTLLIYLKFCFILE